MSVGGWEAAGVRAVVLPLPPKPMDGSELSENSKLGHRLSLAYAMERNAATSPDQGLAKIQATVRARVAREKQEMGCSPRGTGEPVGVELETALPARASQT